MSFRSKGSRSPKKYILKELNIEETKYTADSKKPLKYTNFGGRVRIDILTSEGDENWIEKVVNVGGWIRSLLEGGDGAFSFIDLNDGSSVKNLQIIVNKEVDHYADLLEEGIGSCIQFRGEIVKSPGDNQPIEMKVEKNDTNYIKIMNLCSNIH